MNLYMKTLERMKSESATGCIENPAGLGKYFGGPDSGSHAELTPEKAADYMLDGGVVSVPNAGAGSYEDFFKSVGFTKVKRIYDSSSAGDWTLGIYDGFKWIIAYQNNRYPHCGFNYSYSWDMCSDSFEELCELIEFF